MKDIRKGNDINVRWGIYAEGAPFSLEGKEISLYLRTPYGKKEVTPVVEGNAVLWTFLGKDQKHTGKHSLELVINEDAEGMVTTDACDFVNLVSCSCKVGGADEANVTTESIELTSELGFLPYDDAELREAIEGKVDKEEGKGLSTNDYTDEDKKKNVVASFLNGESLQGLPFGYVGGTYQSYQFDGEVSEEMDLGQIAEYYYGNIAFSYEGKLYEFKIADLKSKGATLGTIYVSVNEDYHLIVKQFAPRVALLGWRTYVDRTKMPSAWVEGGGSGGGSYDDTGIKKDISDLKANDALQDTKLAKLSARVDNLEEGCLHRATYGVDTYDEVKALWEAGKHVICSYNGIDYLLSVVYETQIFFNAVNGYTSYRVFVNSNNVWGKQSYQLEQTSNKTTTISESSTDTQYPSAKAVYDATQKMMPATPSGDPMHYMFEAAGATYNATDADIPMVGMYGDSYVHKAKHWHLNELGDLTTQEIREIYASRYPCTAWNKNTQLYFSSFPFRTNMSDARTSNAGLALLNTFSSCKCKNIIINSKVYSLGINNMTSVFIYANNLEKILNELNVSSISTIGDSFRYLYKLKEVRLKGLKGELNIKESNLLSNASILFMIQNEAAVSAITITLHADAYDRAMADAEITAALAAHPNVSLAKA